MEIAHNRSTISRLSQESVCRWYLYTCEEAAAARGHSLEGCTLKEQKSAGIAIAPGEA